MAPSVSDRAAQRNAAHSLPLTATNQLPGASPLPRDYVFELAASSSPAIPCHLCARAAVQPAMQGRPASDTRSAKRDWWWIFDPRCSLRARSALSVGGGLLAFTFLLSWITATLFRRALENHLATTFETLAFQVGDKLDRAVYERYRMLQTAASLAALRDSTAPIADRRRVLEVLQESSPEFAWIGLTNSSGEIIAATKRRLEGTPADARPWFRHGRELPFVGPLQEIPDLAREAPAAHA